MSLFMRTPQPVEAPSVARRSDTGPVEPVIPTGPVGGGAFSGGNGTQRSSQRRTNLAAEPFATIRKKVHSRLLSESSATVDTADLDRVRQEIQGIYSQVLTEERVLIGRVERDDLLEQIMAEILGFGPIEPLLQDPDISEVMVNGPKLVYVERRGKLERTDVEFLDDDHVFRIIQRIVTPLGRRIDESSPMVDARLPDGSRVNAIIPPLALNGPTITIRKFAKIPLTVSDLIRFGTFDERFEVFMKAAIAGRLNTIISGGTGSGKTTTLNILSSFLPSDERILTVEECSRASVASGSRGATRGPSGEH